MPGQDVAGVLSLFGKKTTYARNRYSNFITDGLDEGYRDDLVGRRSPEGANSVDARVLGAPDFVEEIRLSIPDGNRPNDRRTIDEIIETAAAAHGVPRRAISGGSRLQCAVRARAEVCRLALDEGHSAAEVGRQLGMTRYSVGRAGRREE